MAEHCAAFRTVGRILKSQLAAVCWQVVALRSTDYRLTVVLFQFYDRDLYQLWSRLELPLCRLREHWLLRYYLLPMIEYPSGFPCPIDYAHDCVARLVDTLSNLG